MASTNDQYIVRLLAPTDTCSALIGKAGTNIQEMRQTSGATIFIDTRNKSLPKCIIQISGGKDSIETALKLIIQRMHKTARGNNSKNSSIQRNIEITFLLCYLTAGAVIGVNGKNFKRIRSEAKVFISIGKQILPRSNEKTCTVRGTQQNMINAVQLILQFYFEVYNDEMASQIIYYAPLIVDFDRGNSHEANDYIMDSDNMNYRGYDERSDWGRPAFAGSYEYYPPGPPGLYDQDYYDYPARPEYDYPVPLSNPPFRHAYRGNETYKRKRPNRNLIRYTKSETVCIKYPLNKGLIGGVIGRGGDNITRIRKQIGVKIKVKKEKEDDKRAMMTISGRKTDVREALFMIQEFVKDN